MKAFLVRIIKKRVTLIILFLNFDPLKSFFMTESNNKWLVVVNPKASVGKAAEDWPKIKQILVNEGIDFEEVLTERQNHAIEIVRNAIVEKG